MSGGSILQLEADMIISVERKQGSLYREVSDHRQLSLKRLLMQDSGDCHASAYFLGALLQRLLFWHQVH